MLTKDTLGIILNNGELTNIQDHQVGKTWDLREVSEDDGPPFEDDLRKDEPFLGFDVEPAPNKVLTSRRCCPSCFYKLECVI